MLCAYTRPRYQVSVYRTIGPLVSLFLLSNTDCEYSLELPHTEAVLTSTVPTIYILRKNKKKFKIFCLKITILQPCEYLNEAVLTCTHNLCFE